MKYLLVIGDGMADEPIPALGGCTALKAASTPTLDHLARHGEVGLVCNCPDEYPAGSDTAILSIFGNDPLTCYTGRSPLEVAAYGLELGPEDTSYRCNLITLEGEGTFECKRIKTFNGGPVSGEEALILGRDLFAHPRFAELAQQAGLTLCPTPSFRQLLVQHGGDIAGLRLWPPHEHEGEAIESLLPSGNENACVLSHIMALAHDILEVHPINGARRQAGQLVTNGIWIWAAGKGTELESFEGKYGTHGAVISAVPLVHGIARLSGLRVVDVPGATGRLETDYAGKVSAALAALDRDCDFAAVHLEAPDACSHDRDLAGKLQAIERLDRQIVKPLVAGLQARGEAFRLLVVSDHRTLVSNGRHDGAPVPFLLYDSRAGWVDTGAGLPYNEENGTRGRLFPRGCAALMPLLFEKR